MKRFQYKTVLVTGASRGIGRATALEFAKQGANIFGVYFENHSMAESLSKEINELGSECIMIQADVSQPNKIQDTIAPKLSSLDILVNNAGVVFDVSFNETTPEEWKKTFDINVLGTFLCAKFLRHYFNKGGSIINVASISGLHSFHSEWMAYDGSKAWIASITHSMAKAFASQGVRVNAVAPGYVKTDMTTNLSEEFMKHTLEKIYLKRMANPIEIAKTILFLASDDASYVNGATLIADGGMG